MFRYLLAGLLILPVFSLIGCTHNPATGRNQLLWMSTEQEIALGTEAKPQLTKEYGGEVASVELRDYVTSIGKQLARHTEVDYPKLPWEFTVLDSEIINAFALPGGKVFVSAGLMAYMNNEAQLAAVLGHEIGHVTAQHGDERISQAMLASGIAVGAGLAASGEEGWVAQTIPLVVGVAGQGYLLSFSRSQESEADRMGMRYMVQTDYNPQGMLELLQILIDASGGQRRWEILATHPDPNRRWDEADKLLRDEYSYTQKRDKYQLNEKRFNRKARPHLPKPAKSQTSLGETGTILAMAGSWCGHCRNADLSQKNAAQNHPELEKTGQ